MIKSRQLSLAPTVIKLLAMMKIALAVLMMTLMGEKVLHKSNYKVEDLADPRFLGIFCPICDIEIAYDPCPNCEVEE